METEKVGSIDQEQVWILKYRAALDLPSRRKSRIKALLATFSKVAGILNFCKQSILKKRASAPPPGVRKEPAKTEPAKTEPAPSPVVADRRSHRIKSAGVQQCAARKQPSLQGRSRRKAS
jgi:hypothetical protein